MGFFNAHLNKMLKSPVTARNEHSAHDAAVSTKARAAQEQSRYASLSTSPPPILFDAHFDSAPPRPDAGSCRHRASMMRDSLPRSSYAALFIDMMFLESWTIF